jgi:putative tributyrin esterase
MPLAHIDYWCPALRKQCGLLATWPDDAQGPLPTVYQLHGLSDDHTIWQRRTSIERYADRHRLLVVMPDGGRSFYCDSPLGRHEQHLLDTIDFVERTLPSAGTRATRCIGGLSMGGYGAMKLALKHPGRFVSVASHSGCLAVGHDRELLVEPEIALLFGQGVPPDDDCFALAEALARLPGEKPALRFDCGTEDFLLDHNRSFHAHLEQLRMPHQYEEHPGAHSWEYWDRHVDAALAFHRACIDAAAVAPTKAAE